MQQLHVLLPSLDMEDGVFRAWWFDPLTASLSFGFFIMWYWYEERKRGLSRDKTLNDGIGYGQAFESLVSYWIGVYLFKCIISPPSPVLPDGIPCNASDIFYLFAEVSSGIVLYDAGMFFVHWAMHQVPCLRRIHARHHEYPEATLEARDTLRHSLLDGSLQVLVNICVQRTTPWGMTKSRLARALHNILVTWMLAESHTASPYPYIWRRWCIGVRQHRLHHLGSLERHQQFFGYLDDSRTWWRHQQHLQSKLK